MKNLEIKRELITPEIARKYLEQNVGNRKIAKQFLLRYTYDMINGKWKEDTAEPIKISNNGRVLDGQHRLHAVEKSGVSIYFYVAHGLDDSVFDVIDTGKVRNAPDSFSVAGIKNSNCIPSIIQFYDSLKGGRHLPNSNRHLRLSTQDLLSKYYENEHFWQSVTLSSISWYHSFARILPVSTIGGFYALFYEIDNEKSRAFMNELCTGYNISNQTIIVLRNLLIKDKMSLKKMTLSIKLAFIIKTWNYYIKGREVKLLRYNPIQEEFPSF